MRQQVSEQFRPVSRRALMVGAGMLGVAASGAACSPGGAQTIGAASGAEATRIAMINSLADEVGGDRGAATNLVDTVWPYLFEWTPPVVAPSDLDLIVAFAFGNRLIPGTDPARTLQDPGPVNADLARVVAQTRSGREVPVYAQWEIARILRAAHGMDDVISIDPITRPDGTFEYLSTSGVAAAVAEMRKVATSAVTETAGVIGFADHAWRCVKTTEAAGFTAFAPGGIELPDVYDSESGQEWTRSRQAYLSSDFLGRMGLLLASTKR